MLPFSDVVTSADIQRLLTYIHLLSFLNLILKDFLLNSSSNTKTYLCRAGDIPRAFSSVNLLLRCKRRHSLNPVDWS